MYNLRLDFCFRRVLFLRNPNSESVWLTGEEAAVRVRCFAAHKGGGGTPRATARGARARTRARVRAANAARSRRRPAAQRKTAKSATFIALEKPCAVRLGKGEAFLRGDACDEMTRAVGTRRRDRRSLSCAQKGALHGKNLPPAAPFCRVRISHAMSRRLPCAR